MSLIQEALEKVGTPTPPPIREEKNQPSRNFQKTARTIRKARVFLSKSYRDKKIKEVHAAWNVPKSVEKKSLNWNKAVPYILILIAMILVSEFMSRRNDEHSTFIPTSRMIAPKAVSKDLTTSKAKDQTPFHLTGITYQDGAPLALINNQVVGVGDTLKENAQVVSITNRSATIQYKRKKISLSLE
jgi:hypothetical protein